MFWSSALLDSTMNDQTEPRPTENSTSTRGTGASAPVPCSAGLVTQSTGNGSDRLLHDDIYLKWQEVADRVSRNAGTMHTVLACPAERSRHEKMFPSHRIEEMLHRWRELGCPDPVYPQGTCHIPGMVHFLKSLGEEDFGVGQNDSSSPTPPHADPEAPQGGSPAELGAAPCSAL